MFPNNLRGTVYTTSDASEHLGKNALYIPGEALRWVDHHWVLEKIEKWGELGCFPDVLAGLADMLLSPIWRDTGMGCILDPILSAPRTS